MPAKLQLQLLPQGKKSLSERTQLHNDKTAYNVLLPHAVHFCLAQLGQGSNLAQTSSHHNKPSDRISCNSDLYIRTLFMMKGHMLVALTSAQYGLSSVQQFREAGYHIQSMQTCLHDQDSQTNLALH